MAYTGKNKPNGSKSSPATLFRKQRLAAALELRLRGKKLEEIADLLGYDSRSHVYTDIDRGLTYAIREPAEKVKALELMRLDTLLDAWWDSAMGVPEQVLEADMLLPSGELLPAGTLVAAQPPDDKAAAVILKVMERRAKLEGLDVGRSSKLEVSGTIQSKAPELLEGDTAAYGAKLLMALHIAGALQLPLPPQVRALEGSHTIMELGVLPSDTRELEEVPIGD